MEDDFRAFELECQNKANEALVALKKMQGQKWYLYPILVCRNTLILHVVK